MGAFGTLLGNDLRRNVRNGFVLVTGIAAPLALTFVLNLVFGSTGSGRLEIPVGVLDDDRTPLSEVLVGTLAELDAAGVLELTVLDPGADPGELVDDGDLTSVVIVPAGYGEAVANTSSNQTVAPTLGIVEADDAPTTTGIVRAVVTEQADRVDRERVAAVAAEELGLAGPVAPAGGGAPSITLTDLAAGERLGPGAAIAASMAMLFLFFTALAGVGGLLEDRKEGTMARVLAAPVRPGTVVGAKVVVSVVVGVVATGVLMVAARVLLGAAWGSTAGAAALVVAASLAAAGFTLLVTGAARSLEAAIAVQSVAGFVLALLGGSLLPLPEVGVLDAAARLTPHHWFVEGLAGQVSGTGTALLTAVGAMLAFAAVTGLLGAILAQRRMVP